MSKSESDSSGFDFLIGLFMGFFFGIAVNEESGSDAYMKGLAAGRKQACAVVISKEKTEEQ